MPNNKTTEASQYPLEVPNQENFHRITRDELPLHCPLPGTTLWNSHPRVFLPIEGAGRVKCSYCGAVYELVERVNVDES
ncbi:MAG: zinc-finger domain-containing protein [Gammaproteobacteria bacterium]|nr:zinc-finger domain-containing protein [Gammaproteobacteria bacterium]